MAVTRVLTAATVVLVIGVLLGACAPSRTTGTAKAPVLATAPARTAAPLPTIAPTATGTPIPAVGLGDTLLVDSASGRLYAAGTLDGVTKTLVLAASDGHLLAAYDVTGTLGLDTTHGWLYVDGPQGVTVLDAATGAMRVTVPLPAAGWPGPSPAPLADGAAGLGLAFRDHQVFIFDPQSGTVVHTFSFDMQFSASSSPHDGPVPVAQAALDPARRIVYLDFNYSVVCTSCLGNTLLSYDLAAGAERGRQNGGLSISMTPYDGYLYVVSDEKYSSGMHVWRSGYPWRETKGRKLAWAEASVVDTRRMQLYRVSGDDLLVFGMPDMTLRMEITRPHKGTIAGYDAVTDQLYFLNQGELSRWSPAALGTPSPTAVAPAAGAAPPLGVQTLSVPGGIEDMAFSQDGTALATAAAHGSLWLWDLATGAASEFLPCTPDFCPRAVAFSPDGVLIAVGGSALAEGNAGQVRLYRLADRAQTGVLEVSGTVHDVAFSRDGARLAAASGDDACARADGAISLWDTATWQALPVDLPPAYAGNAVGNVAFGPDFLAVPVESARCSPPGADIQIVDAASGRWLRTLMPGMQRMSEIGVNPASDLVAGRDAPGGYNVWHAHTGGLVVSGAVDPSSFFDRVTNVTSAAYSPDGQSLAMAGDGSVMVVGERALPVPAEHVDHIAFAPVGLTLAVAAAEDGVVWVWDLDGVPEGVTVEGPFVVGSTQRQLYAYGRLGDTPKTVVLSAADGSIQGVYDQAGELALDPLRGALYVDQGDQLSVLDAQSGAVHAIIPVFGTTAKVGSVRGPAPQADPAAGNVLVFRDHEMLVIDPQAGSVLRRITFEVGYSVCGSPHEHAPILKTFFDPDRRIVYLTFLAYECPPHIGVSLVSYDLASGVELARQEYMANWILWAAADGGFLYGVSIVDHTYAGQRYLNWIWRDGKPWWEGERSLDAPSGLALDAGRGRLYEVVQGALRAYTLPDMQVLWLEPSIPAGSLAGYDPATDQLYFTGDVGLQPWSPKTRSYVEVTP